MCPSYSWTNLCGNSLASGYDKLPNCSQIKLMIFLHTEMRQHFCILVSQVCLCLMRNFSPPTHPSFIFLYLHPFHVHTRRRSRSVEDLPSEEAAGVSAQMFLSAKGAPSLEHQRGEIVTHSRGKYLWQRDESPAGDSSLANVTPRNEEVAKKKKRKLQIFFSWP